MNSFPIIVLVSLPVYEEGVVEDVELVVQDAHGEALRRNFMMQCYAKLLIDRWSMNAIEHGEIISENLIISLLQREKSV